MGKNDDVVGQTQQSYHCMDDTGLPQDDLNYCVIVTDERTDECWRGRIRISA